jgi:hypothetical protein
MDASRRVIAVTELLLIFPATLFLTSVAARNLRPLQYEPTHTAQQIVSWYTRLPVPVGLWGLLVALPVAALLIGCMTLLADSNEGAGDDRASSRPPAALGTPWPTRMIAAATLAATLILVVVTLHMLGH